jgi:hypothetical protein
MHHGATRPKSGKRESNKQTTPDDKEGLNMKWLIAGIAGVAVIVVVVAAVILVASDDADAGESADFGVQGSSDTVSAVDGAGLVRSGDGLRVSAIVPTPTPGSYEYPSGDMVPDGSAVHPDIVAGGPDDPEAFTMWAFVFNFPDECTDKTCDLDDLSEDAPAKGGVFQADGRVADSEELELAGSVRLGQVPSTGSALENPFGAEIHLAIAPHGMFLGGTDGWRQLNGPVGNPTLWWAASFSP